MRLYDVAVIGGGPVGSQVAYKLAEVGYGVVVLEQKKKLGESVCCTGIVGQECVSSFTIGDDVILGRVNRARLFSPAGKLLYLQREETQAYILDRGSFDAAMGSRAQSAGAEYILNSLVRDVEVGDDRVRVGATRRGKWLDLEARAVVIATGAGSGLAEKLGLGKFGDAITGAQAVVETNGVDEVEVYFGQEMAPGFFAWLVPSSAPMARVGLLSRRSSGFHLRKLMLSLLAQGKIASAEAELSYSLIPIKSLARTYGKRLVAVGSAAGQVKPITGGGIYYGLLCADIAADSLHQALDNNDLSARSLAVYQRRWEAKLKWELEIGYWARKLYEHLSDGQIDRIFGIIKSSGIDEALLKMEDLSFDWHGEAVLRLMKHKVMNTVLGVLKFPFHLRERV